MVVECDHRPRRHGAGLPTPGFLLRRRLIGDSKSAAVARFADAMEFNGLSATAIACGAVAAIRDAYAIAVEALDAFHATSKACTLATGAVASRH